MNLCVHKKLALFVLLASLPLCLFAQMGGKTSVALIPFRGSDQTIAKQFDKELLESINLMRDYSPWAIDMTKLPADVPEGGFPPYVCPSPSMTMGAPFAVTGELSLNSETELWHLRLYLWMMEENRLVFSDELTAYDRDDCRQNLPGMMDWLFSWIPVQEPPKPVVDQSRVIYIAETEQFKWIYLGMRLGGSMRTYTDFSDGYPPFNRSEVILYDNFSVSVHANIQMLSFLGLQLEAVYTTILNDYPVETWSLMFPCMLRGSYRRGTMVIAGMGGIYMNITDKDSEFHLPAPHLGVTGGILFGNKVGPGYIFLDMRLSSDLKDSYHVDNNDITMRRNIVGVGIGYEVGLFAK